MYKKRLKTQRSQMLFAWAILAFIAFAFLSIDPITGAGFAMAVVPIWGIVADKTFKELKPEDVVKLSAEDQAAYFNELNLYKAEQITELKVKMKAEATKEIATKIKELREEINETNKEQLKMLNEAIKAQGLAITKLMKSGGGVPTQKTIEDYLYSIKDELKNARQSTVTIKTDVTSASVGSSAFALDVPGVGQLATRFTKFLGLFNKGTISQGQGGTVRYVDQATVTRNAAWVAEAGVKPESAITWVVKTIPMETVADTIPVTNQALYDIPFMASEIRNFLLKNVDLKIDSSLWNGSGVTPNIYGVYTRADEYVAVASGITDANIYDLVMSMKTSIIGSTSYDPNFVLINPSDKTKYMTLKKDGNNNYVLPPFVEMLNGKMFIDGMEVITSSAITADTMLVGDFTYGTVYTAGGIKIDIGLIDKQFVENMVTVRAEQEMALLVKDSNTDAFAKETGIAAGLVTLAT